MFDNNVFIEGSCKNTVENDRVTGYELQTHITYYRGIPFSIVKDIRVKTDGVLEPRETLRCSVDGGEDWFTLDEMGTVAGHKWEFGEPMAVRVVWEGGLKNGEHKVGLTVIVRTAYIPVSLEDVMERTVTI